MKTTSCDSSGERIVAAPKLVTGEGESYQPAYDIVVYSIQKIIISGKAVINTTIGSYTVCSLT